MPRVSELLDAADRLLQSAAAVIARIDDDERRARDVIEDLAQTHRRIQDRIARYEPVIDDAVATIADLLPKLRRLIGALSQDPTEPAEPSSSGAGGDREEQDQLARDINAIRTAIRHSPHVAEQLEVQIVPALETLRSVAPDLRELLETSRALNEIIGSVAGLSRAKKRADEQLSDSQEEK